MTRSGRRLLGYGYTNAGGVATMDYDANNRPIPEHGYVGVGAGKINMRVECRSVSGTLNVLDCLCYDKGLEGTGNHNDSAWESFSNLSVSRGADGTTVTNSSGSNRYLVADIVTGSYDFVPPFRVEFNFEKLNTDNANSKIQIYDSSNNNFDNWITATGKYVIDVKANEVTWTINGQSQTSKTVSIGTAFVRFLVSNGASFKFSNFEIYPI